MMEATEKAARKRSLRHKLLAYFVFVSLVPFTLAAYVAYETIRREAENSAVRELHTVAEATGLTLDVYMNDRLSDLNTWASLTMVKESLEVPEVRDDVQATFKELTEKYRSHDVLVLLNDSGICLVSNWEGFIGIDFSQSAFFRAFTENKNIVVDLHKSERLLEAKPDSKGWTVIMAAPVITGGKPFGLLASFLKWTAVEKILSSVKVAETGHVFLINKQNKFIGGPDRGRYLRGPKDPGIDLPALEEALKARKRGLVCQAVNTKSKQKEHRIVGLAYLKGQGQFTGLGWRIGAEAPASEMLVFLPKMIRNLGIGAAVIVASVLVLAFVLAGRIVRPIVSMERLSDQVSSGDLTADLRDRYGNDEIGSLANAFGVMIGNLRQQIRNMVDAVGVLGTCAPEISTTSSELARRGSEISTAVTQTSTSVEELKQAAAVASEQAKSVSERSLEVVGIAQQGKKATDRTVERMKLVKDQMESIDETVKKLAERSVAIENIIETVQDLSDQSNLLAVNASIEAARAGEQGKGFTVVAHEIKALADQSKEATEQVGQILKEVRQWVTAVATATQEGGKTVDAAVEQSIMGGESIQVLSTHVVEAAEAATVIDASSKQQSIGIDQVADAMRSIEEALQQTLGYTSRLELAASQLEELRQRFEGLTVPFRV